MGDLRRELDQDEIRELVEKSRAGDGKATGTLCSYIHPKVYKYMYYRINNTDDAQEQTSEVCLKALRSIAQQNGSFYGWIFRIANNTVIDYYRRQGARVDTQPLDDAMEMTNGNHATLYDKLDQAALKDAMDKLSDDQQQVMVLKFIEGYETEEIAEILGKTAGAVRAIQFRGLAALKDRFGKKGDQGRAGSD